jgi:hypothetical protein
MTKWLSSLGIMLLLAGCLPVAKQQSCDAGNIFNSATRTCVPITSGGQTSGVNISSRSPAVSNFTVSLASAAPLSFSIVVGNPLNQGYSIQWNLYSPTSVASTVSNTSSANIPTSAFNGVTGLWTLAAEVYSFPEGNLVTSAQWFLTVTNAVTPTLSKVAGAPLSVSNNPPATVYQVTVNNPVVNQQIVWYFNGVQETAQTLPSTQRTLFTPTNNFLNDNPPLANGVYTIRAELRNTINNTVFDSEEWTVFVNPPNLPQITNIIPSNSTTVTAIDGLNLGDVGFRQYTGISSYVDLCSESGGVCASAQDFCIEVNDVLGSTGTPGNVTVNFYDNSTTNLIASRTFTALNPTQCLGSDPAVVSTFSFNLANANIGEFKNIVAQVRDNGSPVTTISWPVSVRPRNTPPVANQSFPIVPASTNRFQQMDDSNPTETTYTLTVTDADTPIPSLTYQFFFDGVLMNGTNFFPGTSVRTPDCTTGPACQVTIPSFNLQGRVQPSLGLEYAITAQATDNGANGAPPMTSNTVLWRVRPFDLTENPAQTAPTANSIADVGTSICTPNKDPSIDITETCTNGASFIARASAPTTALVGAYTPVAEGTNVIFNMLINDQERDNFTINIQCVSTSANECPNTNSVISNQMITRVNDAFGRRVLVNYTIPQDILVGVSSGTITFEVTVRDQIRNFDTSVDPLGALVSVSHSKLFTLNVTNNNPFPLFDPLQVAPVITDPLDVIAGFPLTLDPGPVTDASVTDGNVIVYQWQVCNVPVCTDPDWVSITGANQRVLRWTPGNDLAGDPIHIRLCLGDNGTDNEITVCTTANTPPPPIANPTAPRFVGPWSAIVAKANSITRQTTNTNLGEVATWSLFDDLENRREMYTAYVSNAGTPRIVVEKYNVALDGTISFDKSVQFTTESDPAFSYPASRISMQGFSRIVGPRTYRGLYIAYSTQSAPAISPAIRVRYIDITDPDDLIFSYSGVYSSNCLTAGIYDDTCASKVSTAITSSRIATITVTDPNVPVGDYIAFHGLKIFSVAAGTYTNAQLADPLVFPDPGDANLGWGINADGECEYTGDGLVDTSKAAALLSFAYDNCSTVSTDQRRALLVSDNTYLGSEWTVGPIAANWIDVPFPISNGRIGEIMVHDQAVLIPYLDNLTNGRLAVAAINTQSGGPYNGYSYGGLGSSNGSSFSLSPQYAPVPASAESFDIANSFSQNGIFHVALRTSLNDLDAHRLTFAAPATVTVTNSVLDVFGAGTQISKPRIASGPVATNNHVFILAQDTLSATNDLAFARINGASFSAAGTETFYPLDDLHEQGTDLRDYRIRAVSANRKAVVATYTNSNQSMISLLRTPGASPSGVLVRPEGNGDQGIAYPLLGTGTGVSNIGISYPFTAVVGSAGAQAGENSKESVSITYSVGASLQTALINAQEETIQASEVGADGRFNPPYLK